MRNAWAGTVIDGLGNSVDAVMRAETDCFPLTKSVNHF